MKIEDFRVTEIHDRWVSITVDACAKIPKLEMTQDQAMVMVMAIEQIIFDEDERYTSIEEKFLKAEKDADYWREKYDDLIGSLDELKERWER